MLRPANREKPRTRLISRAGLFASQPREMFPWYQDDSEEWEDPDPDWRETEYDPTDLHVEIDAPDDEDWKEME